MRSLYQCSQARGRVFLGEYYIECHKRYEYLVRDGHRLTYEDLKNGDNLNCDTCTDCKDFSEIGGKIYRRSERGW